MWEILLPLFLLAFNPTLIGAMRCSLIPEGINTPRSRIETNRYEIFIVGQPKGYVPGETYTIHLRTSPKVPITRNFKKFIFVLEHEDAEYSYSEDQADRVGNLAIIDPLTTFNKKCRNSLVETNDLPKPEVRLSWTAPESGSGCVILKASIVEATKHWFSDDDLFKKICEHHDDSTDVQPDILERCNACTEAKYEVTFEGLWSRNTFPHNFPDDAWKTRFSDMIGASHDIDYEFWSYNGKASEALKELAENGNTAPIEEDLKNNDARIRTIIKAKGLSYPNTTGRTYAAFRVDKNRHLMSVVASVIPSPDWFVGVSKYELCTESGAWLESAIYNLYPWDAGTDGGITYTDADTPLNPGHPIRRIQSNSPNDERSPFYSSDGEEVKPLARLYITRQRVYEKECEPMEPTEENAEVSGGRDYYSPSSSEGAVATEEPSEERPFYRRKCETTRFSDATSCSVTCGTGTKILKRQYRNEEDENDESCKEQLFKTEICVAAIKTCPHRMKYLSKGDPLCRLGEWGNFSSCSTSCGVGTKTRSRQYLHPEYAQACEANPEKENTVEDVECYGSDDNCKPDSMSTNTDCHYGIWTECNVTCGTGFKARYLLPKGNFEDCPSEETVECYQAPCPEESQEESDFAHPKPDSLVAEGSHLPIVNCKVSEWSNWSKCKPHNGICGDGLLTKSRRILEHASNGGRRCPRLLQTRPCRKRCRSQKAQSTIDPLQASWGPANPNDIAIDCLLSKWSEWGPCSQTCNPGAMQIRTRSPIIFASKNGKPCQNVVDFRHCVDLPSCY